MYTNPSHLKTSTRYNNEKSTHSNGTVYQIRDEAEIYFANV
jgi:hypothetical protein